MKGRGVLNDFVAMVRDAFVNTPPSTLQQILKLYRSGMDTPSYFEREGLSIEEVKEARWQLAPSPEDTNGTSMLTFRARLSGRLRYRDINTVNERTLVRVRVDTSQRRYGGPYFLEASPTTFGPQRAYHSSLQIIRNRLAFGEVLWFVHIFHPGDPIPRCSAAAYSYVSGPPITVAEAKKLGFRTVFLRGSK